MKRVPCVGVSEEQAERDAQMSNTGTGASGLEQGCTEKPACGRVGRGSTHTTDERVNEHVPGRRGRSVRGVPRGTGTPVATEHHPHRPPEGGGVLVRREHRTEVDGGFPEALDAVVEAHHSPHEPGLGPSYLARRERPDGEPSPETAKATYTIPSIIIVNSFEPPWPRSATRLRRWGHASPRRPTVLDRARDVPQPSTFRKEHCFGRSAEGRARLPIACNICGR